MRKKIIKLKTGGIILYGKGKENYTAVRVGFFAGHFDNPKPGLAHFLEHCFSLGTSTKDRATMNKISQELIPSLNASTNPFRTRAFFFRTNKLIEKAMQFASEYLLDIVFNPESIKNEKKVVTEEYLTAFDRSTHNCAYQECDIIFKEGNIYANENNLGTPEDIQNITIDDLKNFKEQHYTRNNFFMTVVTKLPVRKVKKWANDYFISKLPEEKEVKEKVLKEVCFDGTPTLKVATSTDKQLSARISFHIDEGLIANRYDYTLDFIIKFFNSQNGLLFSRLRENGLVYSGYLDFALNKNDGLAVIAFQTSKDKFNEVLKQLNKIFLDIYKNGFDQNVFNNIKNNFIYKEDEMSHSTAHSDKADTLFNRYIDYGDLKQTKKKDRLKLINKVALEDILPKFKSIINGDKKPFITIVGEVKEEELPSYKEMCKTLLNKLPRTKK